MAFSTFAWTGQQRPMAPRPPLDPQHGMDHGPVTAWSNPPVGTGQGYSDPQPVDPLMQAPGIQRDLSWAWGKRGTAASRRALAPVGGRGSDSFHNRDVAQVRAAAAHSDRTALRASTHGYNPGAQDTYGEGQSVDWAEGHEGTEISGRAIVKSRPGGQFSDGPAGEFAPTGFRLGNSRRWAARQYTTPLLGAMYSTNGLRGVLPQIVAVPVNQPALPGVRNSGIASNARFLGRQWTLPAMWQTPVSNQDLALQAQNAAPGFDPTVGTGMM